MYELDKKDLRIMYELDLNAKQTIKQISKKVRLSPEVTNYRIKRLEDEKIILGYYTLINVYSLGYELYRVYLGLGTISEEKKKEFLDYLTKLRQVGQIAITGGEYDLIVGIIEKDNISFNKLVEEILANFGSFIRKKEISVITELSQYNKKFLNISEEKSGNHEFYFNPLKKNLKLDSIDYKLLYFLSNNARKNSTEIEKEIKVTRKTVVNRINNLVKKGAIVGFRPVFNRELLNLTYFRILFKLQSERGDLANFLNYFKNNPLVTYSSKCMGSWELEIELAVKSTKEAYDFVSEIKGKNNAIRDAVIIPVLQDLKYQFSF